MKLVIAAIENVEEERAAERVRNEVFGREWKCSVPSPAAGVTGAALHLLARMEPFGEPVATLSVIDTTSFTDLHARFGLHFEDGATSARYTQLAVVQLYRGMHVALSLILEAERQFVLPRRFDYSWLLYNAECARRSSLCRILGFRARSQVLKTEHGRVRALVRVEKQYRLTGAAEIVPNGLAGLQHVA
jgi:hypothetical protein